MCGRYVLASKIKTIEQRFNVQSSEIEEEKPSYNICPGQKAMVITDDNPFELQQFRFGMTPFWAKKPMLLINARAEGDRNRENDPKYSGSKDIITKPAFRKPIRSQRCLIIADGYIEGTTDEKLNRPFMVFLRNYQRPFSFAGIWDQWVNPQNSTTEYSFSIITTTPNELIQKIPHHRMPVILNRSDEKKWLNTKTPLADITRLLHPFEADQMNAYPIENEIKDHENNAKKFILPVGQPIVEDQNIMFGSEYKRLGMGRYRIKYD